MKNYDILLCLSGGKDSCSLAFRYKNQGLSILAFTSDVGFMSETAKENIHKVIGILDIDHIFYRHSQQTYQEIIDDYFSNSEQGMQDVCFKCSLLTQQIALMIAGMFEIPIIVMGFTKYSAEAQGWDANVEKKIGDFIILNPYYKNYDLKMIEKMLSEHGIISDPTKTNCKYIQRIITTHIERFGENPFKRELDSLLKDNHITQEEYDYYRNFTEPLSQTATV